MVEAGSFDTRGWELDEQGKPRTRLDLDYAAHHFSVLGRAKGKSQYAPIFSGDVESRRNYFGYSAAEDAVYFMQDGHLVRKSLTDGVSAAVSTPSEAQPYMVWDELRHSAVGVGAYADVPTVQWLDPQLGAVQATLNKVLKNQVVTLSNWSADRTRFVVRASAPNSPPVWYLFDVTRKELSPLGEEYPELKGASFGATQWITYKARDGMEIPAYLTLPAGAAAGAKPPLVVLPHGGPAARDTFDFDFLVQFLTSRGYAVLQPQFRGSYGFGKPFEDAGKGEWAGKMQTDLLDGVAAVAGKADTSRVCIVGASFGGYAALAGAALHPEAYKCAASIAGISDLGMLLQEEGRAYGRDGQSMDELREMLGQTSPGTLAAVSPARQVAQIKAPILLIHGDKDTVVALEQSQHMADALKAAAKPFDLVVLQGENHYLTRTPTRTQMLQSLGDFLAKNLPVAP